MAQKLSEHYTLWNLWLITVIDEIEMKDYFEETFFILGTYKNVTLMPSSENLSILFLADKKVK